MLIQNYIADFKNYKEINDMVRIMQSCKYNNVKDIRIIQSDKMYNIKAQIVYEFDDDLYEKDNNTTGK